MEKYVMEFYKEATKAARDAGRVGKIEPSRPSAYDFKYEKGNLMFYDSCLGSGKFVGQMGIWKNDLPVWAMNYKGQVVALGFKEEFLNSALNNVGDEPQHHLRGAPIFAEIGQEYRCDIEGDEKDFVGHEEIFANGTLVYRMSFNGGEIVD
ncbi:MAG: DUF5680 domain-containing protein [Defluviitaleaceae bacterium]|nr:DUF5680 domain-containing protein [Defluviitaleaceae bacterium]